MTADELWRTFRATGDPASLGALFDAVSPELFRIALSLAPDAASAEDALQETWLVALKSAPRHDGARPVVPWLVGILRREVHAVRRRARRPDDRRVSQLQPPDDPAREAESAEEIARARAALDALPVTYREVAVLRWRYGLEPGEIADARRMPPGTVRSLLHRALARLRRDVRAAPALLLGVRWPRGLDDVRKSVLRAAAGKTAAGATSAVIGGLLVAKATKTALIVAAACLLLGAGTVWTCRDGGDATPARTGEAAGTETPAARGAARHPTAPGRATAPGSGDAPAPAAMSPSEDSFARGIVVDEAGAPVAGCRVFARVQDYDNPFESQVPVSADGSGAATTTDAQGTFGVAKCPRYFFALCFVADGFAAREVRKLDEKTTNELRIELAPCAPLEGVVRDTEGRPIAHAAVVVRESVPSPGSHVAVQFETGADGRFVFRSPPAAPAVTSIRANGYVLREMLEFKPIAKRDVYVLERDAIVVDAVDDATGAPLPEARGAFVRTSDGAVVCALVPGDWPGCPRVEGRLVGVIRQRQYWSSKHDAFAGVVQVAAPGHAPARASISIAADAEPPHLVMRLAAGTSPIALSGRVQGGAGARIAVVESGPPTRNDEGFPTPDLKCTPIASADVAADGAFSFAGLPAGTYRLVVTRAGEAPFAIDVAAPRTDLDLAFPVKATLDVLVVDAEGHAAATRWVHVETTDSRWFWNAETDAAGHAKFDALPPAEIRIVPTQREWHLWQSARSYPIPELKRTLAPGERAEARLVLPAPVAVTVTARDSAGHGRAGVSVSLYAAEGYATFPDSGQEHFRDRKFTTDAEGRVALTLISATYVITGVSGDQTRNARLDVADKPATAELLFSGTPGVIHGRIVERGSGAAVAGRPVHASSKSGAHGTAVTDAEGRFVISGVPAGRVHLTIAGTSGADSRRDKTSPYPYAYVDVEMQEGEDRALVAVLPRVAGPQAEPRSVEIVVKTRDAADGSPVADTQIVVRALVEGTWLWQDAMDAWPKTDAAGNATLRLIAADRYVIDLYRGGRHATATITAKDTSVELVVPAK